jgi:bacterioferritin
MDKSKLIEKLNEAVALELGALLQYSHYGQVVTGTDRKIWREFFEHTADEALTHARRFGDKVVSLGGTPTVEHAAVRHGANLEEMLRNSLAVERRAVEIYEQALEIAQDNTAYRNLLEAQVEEEADDVEELEKYMNQVQKTGRPAAARQPAHAH